MILTQYQLHHVIHICTYGFSFQHVIGVPYINYNYYKLLTISSTILHLSIFVTGTCGREGMWSRGRGRGYAVKRTSVRTRACGREGGGEGMRSRGRA